MSKSTSLKSNQKISQIIIGIITREGIPTQFTAGMNRYNLAEGKLQSVKKYLISL